MGVLVRNVGVGCEGVSKDDEMVEIPTYTDAEIWDAINADKSLTQEQKYDLKSQAAALAKKNTLSGAGPQLITSERC